MNIDTQVQVTANLALSEQLQIAASNLIEVLGNPWFVLAVFVAFNVGQATHVLTRAYMQGSLDVTKMLLIWLSQLVSGAILTYVLVDHPNVVKYMVITGFLSATTYYVLRGVARKMKWPWLYTWLTLQKSWVNSEGKLESGGFIAVLTRRS